MNSKNQLYTDSQTDEVIVSPLIFILLFKLQEGSRGLKLEKTV